MIPHWVNVPLFFSFVSSLPILFSKNTTTPPKRPLRFSLFSGEITQIFLPFSISGKLQDGKTISPISDKNPCQNLDQTTPNRYHFSNQWTTTKQTPISPFLNSADKNRSHHYKNPFDSFPFISGEQQRPLLEQSSSGELEQRRRERQLPLPLSLFDLLFFCLFHRCISSDIQCWRTPAPTTSINVRIWPKKTYHWWPFFIHFLR